MRHPRSDQRVVAARVGRSDCLEDAAEHRKIKLRLLARPRVRYRQVMSPTPGTVTSPARCILRPHAEHRDLPRKVHPTPACGVWRPRAMAVPAGVVAIG